MARRRGDFGGDRANDRPGETHDEFLQRLEWVSDDDLRKMKENPEVGELKLAAINDLLEKRGVRSKREFEDAMDRLSRLPPPPGWLKRQRAIDTPPDFKNDHPDELKPVAAPSASEPIDPDQISPDAQKELDQMREAMRRLARPSWVKDKKE